MPPSDRTGEIPSFTPDDVQTVYLDYLSSSSVPDVEHASLIMGNPDTTPEDKITMLQALSADVITGRSYDTFEEDVKYRRVALGVMLASGYVACKAINSVVKRIL